MVSERQFELLNFIIEEYIESAKPVASALVNRRGKFRVSPATIRNDMNDLEEAGLLTHLHTSGGRVPTDAAYRFYVDSLLEDEISISNSLMDKIDDVLSGDDPREINKSIAKALSDLSDNIVITGISHGNDFNKFGISSLFEMPEFREFKRVFQMANFFDEFDESFKKLEREFFQSDDLNIYIGRENPEPSLRHEAVMCATYNLPGGLTGNLTLIGPTRMDYHKNISLITYVVDKMNNQT